MVSEGLFSEHEEDVVKSNQNIVSPSSINFSKEAKLETHVDHDLRCSMKICVTKNVYQKVVFTYRQLHV
jgi:hypothetical protein